MAGAGRAGRRVPPRRGRRGPARGVRCRHCHRPGGCRRGRAAASTDRQVARLRLRRCSPSSRSCPATGAPTRTKSRRAAGATSARIATAARCEEATGFAPGGVAPFRCRRGCRRRAGAVAPLALRRLGRRRIGPPHGAALRRGELARLTRARGGRPRAGRVRFARPRGRRQGALSRAARPRRSG